MSTSKQAMELVLNFIQISCTSIYSREKPMIIEALKEAIKNQGELVERKPIENGKFARAWIKLNEFPGAMMTGPDGPFGPIGALSSCTITTSDSFRSDWERKGDPFIEVWLTPKQQCEPVEMVGYFVNVNPPGVRPNYQQVTDDCANDSDVVALYTAAPTIPEGMVQVPRTVWDNAFDFIDRHSEAWYKSGQALKQAMLSAAPKHG